MLRLEGILAHAGGRRLFGPLAIEFGPEGAVIDGPSGAGKTTLLKLIAGLSRPVSGRVIHADGEGSGPLQLRAHAHYVAQEPLLPGETLREALNLGRLLEGRPPADDGRLHLELEALGLAGLSLEQAPATLSGGERMRLALLRGLLLERRWLLLDEPSAALDPASTERLLERLHAPAAGVALPALLAVSHDPHWLAAGRGRRLRLERGELRDA
jgi:ABC-type multidrug transport system ATPase subunit